jgi:hypothetical protein
MPVCWRREMFQLRKESEFTISFCLGPVLIGLFPAILMSVDLLYSTY